MLTLSLYYQVLIYNGITGARVLHNYVVLMVSEEGIRAIGKFG